MTDRFHWHWDAPSGLESGCVHELAVSFAGRDYVSVTQTRGNDWWVESTGVGQKARVRVVCYDKATEEVVSVGEWSEALHHVVQPRAVPEADGGLMMACLLLGVLSRRRRKGRTG